MYTENMDYYLHQILRELQFSLTDDAKSKSWTIQFMFIYVYSATFRILLNYNYTK